MKVFFKGNALWTKLKVCSTITQWSKEYESIIDTGAFNTAIPENEIISNESGGVYLKFTGVHKVSTASFKALLNVYESTIIIGEEDKYKEMSIIAVPNDSHFLIGREVISQYKWEIDFKLQIIRTVKQS